MTIRSLIIGLLLALPVAALGYVNDWVCRLPYVASDLMPVSVYGLLLLGLLFLNPLLAAVRLRRLSGPEWGVIFSLVLVSCVIPGPGLLWQFHNALVMPHHMARMTPGWQASEDRPALLDYVPEALLADPDPGGKVRDGDVVDGFLQGLGEGDRRIRLSQVPWRGWLRPYAFYIPLLLLGSAATIGLMLILHVQWSRHEHLPYPMAVFASSLLGNDAERPFAHLLRDKPFWFGFAVSFGILAMNGSYAWWPSVAFAVPQVVDLRPLVVLMPWLKSVPGGLHTLLPRFFFAVIGLAFLINAEVSFSIGISMLAYSLVFGSLAGLGISVNNEYMAGGVLGYQLFGAYVGAALFMLYTGRHFYWTVVKGALGRAAPPLGAEFTVNACRVVLGSSLGMVVLLRVAAGIDWFAASCLVLLFGLLFVNVTRINAETGLLLVQPTWQPVAILIAVFGTHALGPVPLITAGLLCVVLTIDPRVCLMPLVANGLKLNEKQRVGLPALGTCMMGGLTLCLVIALPVTLYFQYAAGGGVLYGWANSAARMPFDLLARELHQLAALGTLESAGAATGLFGFARLVNMQPNRVFLTSTALGIAAVMACSMARLRWKHWPIHPVLFMVWGTIVSRWFAGSFLFGWLLKWAVVRFGTTKTYRAAHRFAIGLIGGEMVAGVFWMIVGGIYYLVTKEPPPLFRVHL